MLISEFLKPISVYPKGDKKTTTSLLIYFDTLKSLHNSSSKF